jgi:hypothetical protein
MEQIKVNDSRLYGLVALYDIHTGLFSKAIDGISDDDAHNRLQTKANHVAWLTGSLVEQRFDMARGMGLDKHQQGDDLFKNYQGIKDDTRYPALKQYLEDWNAISADLRKALVESTTEKVDSMIDMGEAKMSFFELLSFMMYREANIIGQIALWRRLLGYEAIKYM